MRGKRKGKEQEEQEFATGKPVEGRGRGGTNLVV
jgi:hypothetical protein